MMRRILIILVSVFLFFSPLAAPALAGVRTPTPTPDSAIHFGETTITYNVPDGYTFHVTITTPGVIPKSGRFTLIYLKSHQLAGSLRIDKDHPEQLSYYVDTSSMFIFPFVPLKVQWDISDAQGRTGSSGTQTIVGEDPRYQWETLESDRWGLSIHYHDRDPAFGQTLLEAAEQSAEMMEDDFNIQLARPIQVIAYNTHDEIIGYLDSFDENTGGQAFSNLGVTIQVVEYTSGMESWIKDVIPHEISHLYFYQATGGNDDEGWQYIAPSWLNEGLAEISANGMDPDYLENINWTLKHSDYLPSLTYLDYNFNEHAEVAEIDYQMAYSITCYLINTYGDESIARLLDEYANGAATEEAFLNVLGINFTSLSNDWRTASGLPLDAANYVEPTPTGTPEPTPAVSPTAMTPSQVPVDHSDVIIGVVSGLAVLGLCGFYLIILIAGLLIILDQRSKKQQLNQKENQPGPNPPAAVGT
jgi:hypothetical protein